MVSLWANQPHDERPDYRPRVPQPNTHRNEQAALDDLHRCDRPNKPSQPHDRQSDQLENWQPNSLANEQVIPQGNGNMPVNERETCIGSPSNASRSFSVVGSSSCSVNIKDIRNGTTTITESAGGEPRPCADLNSNSELIASQNLYDPVTSDSNPIRTEARTYTDSNHVQLDNSHFAGNLVIGNQTIVYREDPDRSKNPVFDLDAEPISMEPSPNQAFTGREEILVRLESLLRRVGANPKQPRAAIYGLGGVGKTTIATEFCYRRKTLHPTEHIFWLDGDTHDAFNNSYLKLGYQARILGGNVRDENWAFRVKGWLDCSYSGEWIMVIDNFDEVDSYMERYLPVKRGAILFTTRDARIGKYLAYVAPPACVSVEAMSNEEAIAMLTKLLTIGGGTAPPPNQETLDLLKHLENLPLAIEQAAAYIRETSIEVSEYMQMFKKCEQHQQELLEESLPPFRRDCERPGSRTVMTTWTITLTSLKQEHSDSVRLLECMSYLSPDDISKELLRGLPFKSEVKFTGAFGPLLSFSFINPLKPNFRMHRLVGLCVRRQIDSEVPVRRDGLLETVFGLLGNAFPEDMENVKRYLQLRVHTAVAFGHTPDSHQFRPYGLRLMHLYGISLGISGDYGGALVWYRRALDCYKKDYGKDHPETLTAVSNMATIYRSQGEYGQALQLFQAALKGYEKAPGNDPLSIPNTMGNIGNAYAGQKKYCKALEWYQRALGHFETIGSDHPDILITINNMACIYDSQEEYDKALQWYQRALDGRKETFGEDHPYTLSTVNNMACTYSNQRKHGVALEWFQRALAGYEKAFGKDHPDTLNTVYNIAHTYCSQGKYGDALVWYQRALDGREKALGEDHPNTLATASNMANVYGRQEEYGKALEWYQRALHGRENTLGKDHPDTLTTVSNMAYIYDSQGEYGKALEWYQRALDSREEALGRDHHGTLTTVSNIGRVYGSQGEYDKALACHQRALDGREKALGKEHPDTLHTVNNMADAYFKRGEYGKALEYLQRALDSFEKTLGDNPKTFDIVNNIANVYVRQEEYGQALAWFNRALDGLEKTLGGNHPKTFDVVNNVAGTYFMRGEYSEALEWFQRTLKGRENVLGIDNPRTLDTAYHMARIYRKQGDYQSALEFYQRALDGYKKVYGSDHPKTRDATSRADSVRLLLSTQKTRGHLV